MVFVDLAGVEVSERLTVTELVALYETAEADIRRAFGLVAAATQRLTDAFRADRGITLRGRHRGYCDIEFSEPDITITELRRTIWERLIERSEIRKAMSVAAWDKLEKQIREEKPLPVTIDNVEGMLAAFRADMPEMLKAAVDEIFAWLRPRSGEYKTNSLYEIGERVILSSVIRGPGFGGWGVSTYYEQNLIALENVFAMVGGKVRDSADGYYSRLSTAIKACKGECRGETDLFTFRGCRNGNLHLIFRRMDLVAKLNAVAGGARLKPARAA